MDEVILEKINAINLLIQERFDQNTREHSDIREQLDAFNGQIKQNSDFRVRGQIYFAIIWFVLTALAIPVALMAAGKYIFN